MPEMPTRRHDCFEQPVSCSDEALAGVNAFVDGFVRFLPSAADVMAVSDALPHEALPAIYSGMLCLFSEQMSAPSLAAPYVERARACRGLHPREQGLLALLEAWQVWDLAAARRIADELLQRWPGDLATLKLAQYHHFNAADAGAMLQSALLAAPRCEQHAAWHSMVAFAHEQCHALDAAEASAQRALAIDADEPWAHHVCAHVHLGRGSTGEGRAFLSNVADSWQGLNSFMFTHNWWHLALFEIAEGDVQTALTLYDTRCWGVQCDYSQDQIGAVSLLARLECAGVDVGDRWQALRPWLEARHDDVTQPFLSLQYLHGLLRAGSPVATELLAAIEQQAVSPLVASDAPVWQEVGIPLARALVSLAAGLHADAADGLSTIRRGFVRIGGSHAQRDLFEQLYLEALLGAGRVSEAGELLQRRQRYEPHNPVIAARLAAL